MNFTPQPADRFLLLAPHPDDETLAVGGLVHQAVRIGASVRVLYLTDGENNPWAQRANEWQWTLRASDRLRWGVRRRAEALAALQTLGVPADQADFLGFPDQGLTDLLLEGNVAPIERLSAAIESAKATHMLVPSLADAHPDHNALAVMAAFALERFAPLPRHPILLSYLVHRPRVPLHSGPVKVSLSEEDLAIKRRALHCHPSQLRLNRRGLYRYLLPEERLWLAEGAQGADFDHSIRRAAWGQSGLTIELAPDRTLARGKTVVYVVGRNGSGAPTVLRHTLPRGSGASAPLALSLPGGQAGTWPSALFVKLANPLGRRFGFFDQAGWVAIPTAASAVRTEATMAAVKVLDS